MDDLRPAWQTPALFQLKMDAEIGSYQEDREPWTDADSGSKAAPCLEPREGR
jgi:hypothetical protein